jgi:hypothetical protein
MKKTCPKQTRTQCVWWEVAGISLLVFLAVYSIVTHVPGYTLNKELVIAAGASFSVLWCLWIVRTFRNIMTWWTDLQLSIDHATKLLEETKQDLKEIKSIKHEFSSR